MTHFPDAKNINLLPKIISRHKWKYKRQLLKTSPEVCTFTRRVKHVLYKCHLVEQHRHTPPSTSLAPSSRTFLLRCGSKISESHAWTLQTKLRGRDNSITSLTASTNTSMWQLLGNWAGRSCSMFRASSRFTEKVSTVTKINARTHGRGSAQCWQLTCSSLRKSCGKLLMLIQADKKRDFFIESSNDPVFHNPHSAAGLIVQG